MGLSVLVANTNAVPYVSAIRIEKSDASEVTTLVLKDRTTPGVNSAARPAMGDVYLCTWDAALLSGGHVVECEESVVIGANATPTMTTFRVVGQGYEAIPAQIHVADLTLPAGNLYSTFASLVDAYLIPRGGMTRISPSTGGPSHPSLTFEHVSLADIFNQLTETSGGYPWRINGNGEVGIVDPGTLTYPTTINASAIQSMTVMSSHVRRITRLWASVPVEANTSFTDGWISLPSQDTFLLRVDPETAPTTITVNGTPVTLGTGGWSYDPAWRAIKRTTAPGTDTVISVDIPLTGPVWARVWDPSVQYANGSLNQHAIVDGTVDASRQTSLSGTLDWMQSQLIKRTTAPRVLTFTLDGAAHHLYPWLSVPMQAAPLANINGNVLVQSVTIEGSAELGQRLTTTVQAVEGQVLGYDWREFWRGGSGPASGSSAIVGGSTGGGGTTTSTTIPVRIALGGSGIQQANTANTWIDVPEAIPLQSSPALSTLGTYTLRVPRFVRGTGNVTVALWNQTTNTAAATVASTNATSWATATATVTLNPTDLYLLRMSSTTDAVVGQCVLELN